MLASLGVVGYINITVSRDAATNRSETMNITINETGETVRLALIDPATGCNYVGDYIGNTGALGDGQFARNDDGSFSADQATADWWGDVVTQQQEVDDRLHALKAEYGSDAVFEVLEGVGSVDFGDTPAAIMAALDKAFCE
jgi:hypothetical protein